MNEKQETLIIIKPDSVAANQAGTIINLIVYAGFQIKQSSIIEFDEESIDMFYKQHIDKPFFPQLKQFMISGPCWWLLVEKENAILDARALAGNTNPNLADSSSIRGLFGNKDNIERNSVHTSANQGEFMYEFNIISQLSNLCQCSN